MIMNDKMSRKEMTKAYKAREVVGGVYAITNTQTGEKLIESSLNLQGSKNRFEFSKNTGSCIYKKIQADWDRYGADAFAFEVLEELAKTNIQTDEQFAEDVETLKELWLSK